MADQNVQLIESEEDKKKKAAAQVQPGSAFAGGTTSPVGAPSAAPSAGQQARAAQQAGPTKGTGFTGVGRYLQANVGSRLGELVAGRVAQTGQQAQTRLGQAVGQFGQQLGQQQQQLTQQQQLAQQALQRIATGGAQQIQPEEQKTRLPIPTDRLFVWGPVKPPSERFGTGFSGSLADKYNKWQSQIKREDMPSEEEFLSSLTPDEALQYKLKFPEGMFGSRKKLDKERLSKIIQPVSLTPSQEEIAAYQAVAGGQYQAPTGLEDAAGIRSQVQLAAQLAKGTETTKGRMGLLQQVVGRGPQQYTKGKSALDALILGQSGGELAAARRASAGLERKVGTEEALAAERARQFGAETQRAKTALTGEATSLEKKTGADISARQADYNTRINELVGKIKKEVESGIVSPEVAEALGEYGITPSTRIYDKDFKELATFLAASKGPAEELTATTKEEAARLQALKKLAGIGRQYSEEEMKKVGTTIDPKTGLAISPEEFKSKFVTSGQKRVTDAAQQLEAYLPEFSGLLDETGNISPKTQTALDSSFKTFSSQKSDLENQIRRYNDIIESASMGERRYSPQEVFDALMAMKTLPSQLSAVDRKVSSLSNFLTEYNKGKSLQIKDSLAK